MDNDYALTAARTNAEQTPATINSRVTEPTASAERRAWHTMRGAWEITLATRTSADRAPEQPTLVHGTTSASVHRDGHLYAAATPSRLTVAFGATHVTRSDQVNLRRHQVKQSIP
jgi:hypothetical protein